MLLIIVRRIKDPNELVPILIHIIQYSIIITCKLYIAPARRVNEIDQRGQAYRVWCGAAMYELRACGFVSVPQFGKNLVSKKKRRLVTKDGFNLDMA